MILGLRCLYQLSLCTLPKNCRKHRYFRYPVKHVSSYKIGEREHVVLYVLTNTDAVHEPTTLVQCTNACTRFTPFVDLDMFQHTSTMTNTRMRSQEAGWSRKHTRSPIMLSIHLVCLCIIMDPLLEQEVCFVEAW